jgi:hypothetical protein
MTASCGWRRRGDPATACGFLLAPVDNVTLRHRIENRLRDWEKVVRLDGEGNGRPSNPD